MYDSRTLRYRFDIISRAKRRLKHYCGTTGVRYLAQSDGFGVLKPLSFVRIIIISPITFLHCLGCTLFVRETIVISTR